MFFDKPDAVSNTGATFGVILASIAARRARRLCDRILLLIGLAVTFGFQIWAIYESWRIDIM